MFVGRKEELKAISTTLLKPNQHLLIYGNRRVGKSFLIDEALKGSTISSIHFECTKTSLSLNLNALAKQMFSLGIINIEITSSFIDLFTYLNSLNKRIVIVFDEFPYLYIKNDSDEIESLFQKLLDQYGANINVILSGSNIGMMKALIEKKNPLYGRFNTIIHLHEFNYLEASSFYPHLSNYDKVAFYAVFGGSPYILHQLDETKTLKENICGTLLNIFSSVYNYSNQNYTSDISIRSNFESIFNVIANGTVKYKQIENKLHYEQNGLLSKQLENLIEMGFLKKNSPINKINDLKKTSYSIASNIIRFYYTYIYGKDNLISTFGKETFYNTYISSSINTFISYRFEDIVKQYLSILIKKGELKNIYNIGSFYYDDSLNKTNGEFIVALEEKDGYSIIEVKYLKHKLDNKIIKKEINQIKAIKEINIKNYGFASINGFDDELPKIKYKFDGDDIYFTKDK